MIFKIPSMYWQLPNLYVKFRPLLWVIDFPTAYLTLRISNWFQTYETRTMSKMKHLFSSPVIDIILLAYSITRSEHPFPSCRECWLLMAPSCPLFWRIVFSWNDPPCPGTDQDKVCPITDWYWVFQQTPSGLLRTIWRYTGDWEHRIFLESLFKISVPGIIHWR